VSPRLQAIYLIRSDARSIEARARAIALANLVIRYGSARFPSAEPGTK